MTEIEQLEQAIATLEAQRAILSDAVVKAALAPMREKLAMLKTQAVPAQQQRKQATVLFADVAGFTTMSETMDAEDVTETMNALWQWLDAAIISHGGRIDKHIGDAIMAMWGANQVRENDPEQAIHAALKMQAELMVFKEKRGVQLAMRIGINTGPVFLSEVGTMHEFTAMGDTVNLASRLEHAAPVGGILISHDTYRHVRGVFEVRVLEPITVKGKSEPVQVYVVERAKPRAFRLSTRGVEGVETRMIGREVELKRLQDALRTVSDEHKLQVITVAGEAGVGKSRLLYEFSTWVDLLPETYRVFKGRGNAETGKLPYALLRDVFAFRFEIQDSDPLTVAREKLEQGITAFLKADPNALEKAHFIGHLIGLDFSASPHLRGIRDDPKQIHDRAFHYLAQVFTAAARERSQAGAMLLLEDIHWADDGSLDAVAHLMQACQAAPLFILSLARRTLYERRPNWGEGVEAHARLDLRPLSRRESYELVDEILKKAPEIPPTLREMVVGGAEGNPFYAEELIKMLIDEKVIIPGQERWQVETGRLASVRVPPTLTGVLQARLDGLPHPEHLTLQQASVIGRVFWDEAIQGLSVMGKVRSKSAGNALRTTLQALRAKELVFRREVSMFAGADEYTFKHAILRDVAYESMLKRQRKVCHVQAARWLVARSGERVDEYAGLIAGHFERAGEIVQAAEWYGKAGKQAREAYAPDVAIGYYQKALQFSQQSTISNKPSEIEWYEGLGEALWVQARFVEAAEAYTAMHTAAEDFGDGVAQARAWNGLAWVQQLQGNHRTELESAEQAEATAQGAIAGGAGEPAQVERVTALYQKGWALCRLGDAAGVLRVGEQALALATELSDTLKSRRVRAHCLTLLGVAHSLLSQFEQSDHCTREALVLYRELGDLRDVGMMLNNLGEIARQKGDYATPITHYQEALLIAQEIGNRNDEMIYINNLGAMRVGQGDYATAEVDLRQVIKMVGTGSWWVLSETYRFLAEACLGQGKAREALDAARQALALGQETGIKEYISAAWRTLGNCGLVMDDFRLELPNLQFTINDPQFCFAKSLQIFTEIGMEAERARTWRDWARYELTKGDKENGKAMWREAKEIFERLNMPLEVTRMERQA